MKLLKELVRDRMTVNTLMESFKKEVAEAVAPADVQNTMNKYMGKIRDPNAKSDFLMQAAQFLGRKSSATPEELDLVLRKHYAKNYDPAKLARQQTPGQKAAQQTAQPPPVPQQKPQFGPAPGGLPSLSKLAAQETEPFWKKQGLPPPEALGGKAEPAQVGSNDDTEKEPEKEKEDDIPTAKSSDVKTVRQKKAASAPKAKKDDDGEEVDMDKFGEKEPGEKRKAKSEPAKAKAPEKKKEDEPEEKEKGGETHDLSDPGVSTPTLSSLVKRQTGTTKALDEPKSFKIGDTVNLGHLKGLKVANRNGDWYLLKKGEKKYTYNPSRPYLGVKRLP